MTEQSSSGGGVFDIGKQAKDIAQATDTSVDAVKKLAGFLDGVFGNVISNSMGLLGDKLAYYRLERAIRLQERVEENLRKRGSKRRYIPVSFGLPIIEKATVEEEPVLHEKWVNLLTNAVDADFNRPIRRNYSSILSDLEPEDAKLVDVVVKEHLVLQKRPKPPGLFDKELCTKNLKLDPNVCENAVRNLMRLGLLKPGVVTGGVSVGNHPLSSYKDTDLFGVTQMGVDFYHAVNLEPKKK
jgi:Abortive infection alpha